MRAKSQANAQKDNAEPNELIDWTFNTWKKFEAALKASLGEFAATYKVGGWLQSQIGIGPVISAAMIANFDIRKAPTVGHFWRFAGLDPTCVWEKGKTRPYNAKLKAICVYKMGECFVKFQNNKNDYYGHLFAQKKADLTGQNMRREFAPFAAKEIEEHRGKKCGSRKWESLDRWKDWEDGRICQQNIHDRARRWTVKLFLSHLHEVMYRDFWGKEPPAPFVFSLSGHSHKIEAKNVMEYDGLTLKELYKKEPILMRV